MSKSKHRFVIVIDQKCEFCDSLIQHFAVENEAPFKNKTSGNFAGVQVSICGKTVSVACPHCWERIQNG